MTHEPTMLTARGACWVECTCGWLSNTCATQAPALAAHAHHVAFVKDIDQGDLDGMWHDKFSEAVGE